MVHSDQSSVIGFGYIELNHLSISYLFSYFIDILCLMMHACYPLFTWLCISLKVFLLRVSGLTTGILWNLAQTSRLVLKCNVGVVCDLPLSLRLLGHCSAAGKDCHTCPQPPPLFFVWRADCINSSCVNNLRSRVRSYLDIAFAPN